MIRAINLIALLGLGSGAIAEDVMSKMTLVPHVPPRAEEQLQVMGISTFSMVIRIEGNKNAQLNLYSKAKNGKPKLLVEGPIIRNDENGLEISRRIVITIDGLDVQPRQNSLRIGIGQFGDQGGGTVTVVADNPLPEDLNLATERLQFFRDIKNRIVLVQGYKGDFPMFPIIRDELHSIFLSIEQWKPKAANKTQK